MIPPFHLGSSAGRLHNFFDGRLVAQVFDVRFCIASSMSLLRTLVPRATRAFSTHSRVLSAEAGKAATASSPPANVPAETRRTASSSTSTSDVAPTSEHLEHLVPDVQSPPQTHGIHVATIQLTSYRRKTFDLDFFADFAMRAAHAFQIPTGGIACLPVQTSLWTVPRGPFVHKKSMENFWRRTHRRSIKIYDASDATVDRWLQFLRHHEMPGVASKVQLFRRYPLGVGQQMQSAVEDRQTSEEAVRAMADEILSMQKAS